MNTGVIDWLNENSLRAYPLKETITRLSSNGSGYKLTDNVLVDAQFVYSSLPDTTTLSSIVVSGNTVTFTVGSLSFAIDKTLSFPQSVRLSSGNLLVIGDGAANIPDGTHLFTNVLFEPAVSFEFSRAWLGVSSITADSATLTGNITLIEGHQFDIQATASQLVLDVGKTFGIPISCNTFGDYPTDCANIISFVNGVGADGKGDLLLIAGSGITVLDDPENHRIYIGLSFNADDICRDIVANPEQ